MAKSGFDECVRITRINMKILGIWPDDKLIDDWYLRWQFLLSVYFIIFFINIPQTSMLITVWGDLNVILEILNTANILVGVACLKLLKLWYNKRGNSTFQIKNKRSFPCLYILVKFCTVQNSEIKIMIHLILSYFQTYNARSESFTLS